ncbi:MAG: TrkH family potassium uptake protein [Bacteroidales bacterium]|nr:TrkH family potassium uptake protein [Bacteroidales bacterium]
MNLKTISRNVGYALLVSALFMLLSVFVSIAYGNDSALVALVISFIITFTIGIFPFIFVKKTAEITMKDGYMIIVLSWLLSFIVGMLPFALWGGPFSVQNAWFESVSGYTTTGATILDDIESVPKSLLFWRSSTHFIGGLGVVVFLLLIIPNASPVRLRLTNMELSSLSKEGYSSRTNKVVYVFAYVYLGLVVVSFFAYWLAGMSPFDAICHAFSVSATGGFSTRNLSIGAYDSYLIEGLTMLFMFISSLHFGLVYMAVITRSFRPFNNPVVKFYVGTLVFFSLLLAFVMRSQSLSPSFGQALWDSTFHTLCIATTSGFATVDNADWPMLANMGLFFMGIMCACAGSTSGGIKADRVLLLFKAIALQVKRALYPSAITEVKVGNRILRDEEVAPHLIYISMYMLLLGISSGLLLLMGEHDVDALAASVSALGNVGPSIHQYGTMGSYNAMPEISKMVMTVNMFLGRVEIYPVLAVFASLFKKRIL